MHAHLVLVLDFAHRWQLLHKSLEICRERVELIGLLFFIFTIFQFRHPAAHSMFTTKTQDNVNNNSSSICCAATTISSTQNPTQPVHQQFPPPAMLSSSSASELDQNGNGRDRTHLTLDLKDLKPREASNSGLSPISLPISLLDSSLLMSPEKFLLAAQQHHQNLQQQQQSQAQQLLQQPKLETPTPSNFIFPKNVTTAQETFAEGFHKALQKLQGDSSLPTFQNNSPSSWARGPVAMALTSPFPLTQAQSSFCSPWPPSRPLCPRRRRTNNSSASRRTTTAAT